MVCAPATGKIFEPLGAGVVVVPGSVVVPPGGPVPPLWANAACEPSTRIASARAASNATAAGVRPAGLSCETLPTLSAAYGVSWRARAESGATNQLVAIRPWEMNPFGSPVPPDERVLRRRSRGATRFPQRDLAI